MHTLPPIVVLSALLYLATTLFVAQANDHLPIHFVDLGQGDAAVLISPSGEIVLFDDAGHWRTT